MTFHPTKWKTELSAFSLSQFQGLATYQFKMEVLIDKILDHPLLIVLLSLVCVLLFIAVLKGLLKLLLVGLALGSVYFAYVHFLEESYPLPEIDVEPLKDLSKQAKYYLFKDSNLSMPDYNGTQ